MHKLNWLQKSKCITQLQFNNLKSQINIMNIANLNKQTELD